MDRDKKIELGDVVEITKNVIVHKITGPDASRLARVDPRTLGNKKFVFTNYMAVLSPLGSDDFDLYLLAPKDVKVNILDTLRRLKKDEI